MGDVFEESERIGSRRLRLAVGSSENSCCLYVDLVVPYSDVVEVNDVSRDNVIYLVVHGMEEREEISVCASEVGGSVDMAHCSRNQECGSMQHAAAAAGLILKWCF